MIEPELFYLPIKQNNKEPFIFKLKEFKEFNLNFMLYSYMFQHDYQFPKKPENPFFQIEKDDWINSDIIQYNNTNCICPIGGNEYDANGFFVKDELRYIYFLKDDKGDLATEKNYPWLFTNNPYHIVDKDTGEFIKISKVLCSNTIPNIHIDWGDGNIDDWKPMTNLVTEIIINNHKFTFEEYGNFDVKCNDNGMAIYPIEYLTTIRPKSTVVFRHTFSDDSLFHIVKVYGSFPHISLMPLNEYNKNCEFSLLQWGDCGLKSLNSFLGNFIYGYDNIFAKNSLKYIAPPKYLENVIEVSQAFGTSQRIDSSQFVEATFDMNNFLIQAFESLPNIINCYLMFGGQSSITEIPPYLCKNNPYIISLQYAFAYCYNIRSIGDYAFANLSNLLSVSHLLYCFDSPNFKCPENAPFVDLSYGSYLEQIGNSIFENNISLLDVTDWWGTTGYSQWLYSIGDNLFKNCKSLIYGFQIGTNYFQYTPLTTVGKSMFEGCESLVVCKSLFLEARQLREIGENTFKGCKNLRNVANLFRDNIMLSKIPQNFFADVEYNPDYTNMSSKQKWDNNAQSFITITKDLYNTFNTVWSVFDKENCLSSYENTEIIYEGDYYDKRQGKFKHQKFTRPTGTFNIPIYNFEMKKYEINTLSVDEIPVTKVGQNFFPSQLLKNGGYLDSDRFVSGYYFYIPEYEIKIQEEDNYYRNYATIKNKTVCYRYYIGGYAPEEMWKYNNINVGDDYTNYFGYRTGTFLYTGNYESDTNKTIVINNNWTNYDIIPKNNQLMGFFGGEQAENKWTES